MTNIALFSRQPILAEGLRNVVGSMEGFAWSGVYSSQDFMADSIRRTECPDVLMVDVTPAMTLGALNQLKSTAPAAAVILWIDNVATEYATQALRLGVRGFIFKNASLESHFECLSRVAEGELWIQNDVANKLLCVQQTRLTPRERQLMVLLAQGLKNKEIAWQLKITEGTVKVYLSRLFQKVGANDRFDLALIALRNMSPDQMGGVAGAADRGKSDSGAGFIPSFMSRAVTARLAGIQ
jgi:DNA-binding NarL/FixJ family response regulator